MSHFASRKSARASARPRLEGLEDRSVPSATLVNGNLIITQSNGNDTAVVTVTGGPVGIHFIRVQETINGVVQAPRSFFAGFVGRITYNGLGGNDRFDNQTSVRSTAFGGAGNDVLLGGQSDDVLSGGDGDDELHGRGGNDLLYGDNGNDQLFGDNGADVLHGGMGNDDLFGGFGVDQLFGEQGNDLLSGGVDGVHDILRGGQGADTFFQDPVRLIPPFLGNRDRPVDFNAAEGDEILTID